MGSIPILYFKLEGPLQSWGERSKWDIRDTSAFPSKSGVIGMLACAMGLERDDSRIKYLHDSLRFAVRADRQGTYMVDFHTVQAERLLTAERKPRGGSNTIISRRAYLQDASFTVALTGDIELLRKLKEALTSPKWVIYLGRKSCVPSVPVIGVLTEEYSSLEEAMRYIDLSDVHDSNILVQIDSDSEKGEIRLDVLASDKTREFTGRRVEVKAL